MAPRDLMDSTAMDTVFKNFGMDSADLGVADNDGLTDDLPDDEGDPGDDLDAELGDDSQDDPFAVDDGFDDEQQQQQRVTHTRDQRQQNDQRQQRQPPQRQQAPQKVRPDAKGNLVDAQGKVVAKAGTERRFYESREKVKKDLGVREVQLRETAGRLTRVTEIARQLKERYDGFAAQQRQMQELGIAGEDHIAALNLYSQLKKDTRGTLQKLLTRAAANGISIDGNSQQQTQPNIADVVKEVLNGQLKPIHDFVSAAQQRDQRSQQDQEARVAVQQEVETWFGLNPDARPYAQVILKVLRNPSYARMPLGEIWARVQLNLERQRNSGRQRTGNRNGFTPRRGSPPIGRRSPPSGNTEMADINDDYGSIINSVLDQHGVV
jgi:hypothetical protein